MYGIEAYLRWCFSSPLRVHHEFAKKCIRYQLIHTINTTPNSITQSACILNLYKETFYWNVPCGDTSCKTLIDVCVCVCICLSADISLNCAKNDSTDYPEILWVCWV